MPYVILALEVVVFFRLVLLGTHVIPWDLRGFFLPHTYAIADALRAGELPLWDPSTYCGRPLLANIQMGALYPPVLVTAVLGNVVGVEHLRYLLQWNVLGHILAAGVFSYWLGLALGLSRWSALLLGTVFQLGGFFAAHASHMTALQTAVWFPFTLWCVWRGHWGRLAVGLALSVYAGLAPLTAVVYLFAGGAAVALGRTRWFASAAALSVVLALAQLVPTIELTNLSIAQFRADYLQSGGGVPLPALVSLVSPNHYGLFDLATYKAPYELTFLYLFCGWIPLALAFYAALRRRVWAALTLVAALAMLGDSTPLGAAVMTALPVKIRIGLHPEYVSSAFTLCLGVLAAFGLEQVRPSWRPWLAAAAAVELIAVSSARPMNSMSLAAEPGHSRQAMYGVPGLLETVRELVRTAHPPWRIDTMARAMDWAMIAPMIEVPTSNGNDPFALVRTQQVRLQFLRGERWGSYYEVENAQSPVLAMMNARYLLAGKALPDSGLPLRAEIPGFFVYENPRALPRFWLVAETRPGSRIESADFAPERFTFVEGGRAMREYGEPGTVRVEHYGFNRLRLRVHAPGPRYLATSEAHYPGWQATIDGHPAAVHYTNQAFRGLYVPGGEHTVEMYFAPASHLWPAAASALGGVGLIGFAVRRRRKNVQS